MKTTERITKLVMARKPAIGVRNVKRDIATTCGISYEAVRQWFAGDTENIKNENLVAISEGYDTTVDWLLSGKGEPPRRKESATATGDSAGNSSAADLVQKMLEKHGKGLPEEARQKIVDAVADGAANGQAGNVISADFPGAACNLVIFLSRNTTSAAPWAMARYRLNTPKQSGTLLSARMCCAIKVSSTRPRPVSR